MILVGNGKTLQWKHDDVITGEDEQVMILNLILIYFSCLILHCLLIFQELRFWLREENWIKISGGIESPATRNDLMTVLADLDSIKFRANHVENMKETRLR